MEEKNQNQVAEQGGGKANLAVIIVALLVLVAGAFGIWWYSGQAENEKTQSPSTAEVVETTPAEVAYDGVDGQTALELLKQNYTVETTDYVDMGEFVNAIDGQAADDKHFWAFYVNGEMASEGASTYQTKGGDKITWQLDEIQEL